MYVVCVAQSKPNTEKVSLPPTNRPNNRAKHYPDGFANFFHFE